MIFLTVTGREGNKSPLMPLDQEDGWGGIWEFIGETIELRMNDEGVDMREGIITVSPLPDPDDREINFTSSAYSTDQLTKAARVVQGHVHRIATDET